MNIVYFVFHNEEHGDMTVLNTNDKLVGYKYIE